MGLTTFDTLKFVRRLEEVGISSEQAEVQAEVLTEAFNVNLEQLVTKDFLAGRFAENNAKIDSRFAEQSAYIDSRFAEQNAYIDTRFAEQNAYIDTRFAEQNAYIDSRFSEQNTNFKLLFWMVGFVITVSVLPYLERILSL